MISHLFSDSLENDRISSFNCCRKDHQRYDPAKITVRDIALKTLDEKMRTDNATRIKYASKYASVANYWKKWMGEVEGLKNLMQ